MPLPQSVRGRAVLAGSLLAVALLAVGCGSQASGDEATPTGAEGTQSPTGADALLPPAEGSASYPMTLESPYGQTVLEQRPERIAVVGGLGELEATLALGVHPVVSPWAATDWEWLADYPELDEATVINPWADSLELESILAADPDLIVAITHSTIGDDYERLSSIAPVLTVTEEQDVTWEWTSVTEQLAETLDLAEAGQAVVAQTEQYVSDAAAEHPEYDGTQVSLLINRGAETGIEFVNRSGSPAEALLTELGFAEHPNAGEFDSDWGDVSPENLGLVDADALIVGQHGGTGTAEDAAAWLEGNELYQNLDAVQTGAVGVIEPSSSGSLDIAWSFSYPNAIDIPWTVDELNAAFAPLF